MPAPDATYNGYTNYETWCVSLWLNNEEGSYRHCRMLAREMANAADDSSLVSDGIWTIEEATRNLLADALREFLEKLNPLSAQASVFTDLIQAALSDVDWHELADVFLEE